MKIPRLDRLVEQSETIVALVSKLNALGALQQRMQLEADSQACTVEIIGEDILPFVLRQINASLDSISRLQTSVAELKTTDKNLLDRAKLLIGEFDLLSATVEGLVHAARSEADLAIEVEGRIARFGEAQLGFKAGLESIQADIEWLRRLSSEGASNANALYSEAATEVAALKAQWEALESAVRGLSGSAVSMAKRLSETEGALERLASEFGSAEANATRMETAIVEVRDRLGAWEVAQGVLRSEVADVRTSSLTMLTSTAAAAPISDSAAQDRAVAEAAIPGSQSIKIPGKEQPQTGPGLPEILAEVESLRSLYCEAKAESIAARQRVATLEHDIGRMLFNEPSFFDYLHATDTAAIGFAAKERSMRIYYDAIQRSIEFVEMNRIPGDIVEFGTFEGYTGGIFAHILRHRLLDRNLFLIDSFEGFPEISHPIDRTSYEVRDLQVWNEGVFAIPSGMVEQLSTNLKAQLGDRAHVIKSFFKELAPGQFSAISILHLDCDLYESTIDALEYCEVNNTIRDGMVCLLDDYNCSRANDSFGQRRALIEFMRRHPGIRFSPWFTYGWSGQAMICTVDSASFESVS